jgi:hypothetical protein
MTRAIPNEKLLQAWRCWAHWKLLEHGHAKSADVTELKPSVTPPVEPTSRRRRPPPLSRLRRRTPKAAIRSIP